MTTETENLERIIHALENLNEFDGETVEYILSQIGYSDYMLRSLMMSAPISDVENAYEERIEMDLTKGTKHPLRHRIDTINEELIIINSFIKQHQLYSTFAQPSDFADSCNTHFSNIEIACDLESDECLNWNMYNLKKQQEKPQEKPQEKLQEEEQEDRSSLKYFWQDLNNFNIQAKEFCSKVWVNHRFHTRKQFFEDNKIKHFEMKYIIHEVWDDLENNDTLMFNNFEKYWEFFIANRDKVVSL
jgi:hypothetical protein